MSRKSWFLSARICHSVWCECYDEVMSIPVNKRLKLHRKALALIKADRNERKMNDFINECINESAGVSNA
nr:MAG TPA: hypothetical protein [Caudoviricetes sp.]